MKDYKKEFIEFMIESGVLTFGDFTTKSGRKTPYFINTGNYKNGMQISKLGHYYCETVLNDFGSEFEFNVIFGPAYKGIPLCVSLAQNFYSAYKKSYNFCFNRKETKDHGEGGELIGYTPRDGDKILIIEDVTTSGASIRETVPILKSQAEVEIVGLVVSVNRMEKGTGEKGALEELEKEYGLRSTSIVNIKEIIEYLHNRKMGDKVIIDDSRKSDIEEYLSKYGY